MVKYRLHRSLIKVLIIKIDFFKVKNEFSNTLIMKKEVLTVAMF